MSEPKVAFFIDDDEDFLRIIDTAIQHPRFQVRTLHVDNGYHAIDEIIKLKPDVLFIDFALPRANASQILPILKYINEFSELPIYFVTGYARDAVVPFLKDMTPQGIIFKNDSLRSEILKVLEELDPAA